MHDHAPGIICRAIKFFNIACLDLFIEDHIEILSKFKLVIHMESRSKDSEILIKDLQKSIIVTNCMLIKTMIFMGHSTKISSSSNPQDAAKKHFKTNIYSSPTPLKFTKEYLTYCQSRDDLLDFCLPATPLFALRMFLISPLLAHSILLDFFD